MILVFATLVAGVVGLLMFNTQMQQSSFHATALQQKADSLVAQQQSLDMELEELRDPQRLAQQARRLGMVPPLDPAFVRLSDGKTLGSPLPASPDDAVRINPLPAEPRRASTRRRGSSRCPPSNPPRRPVPPNAADATGRKKPTAQQSTTANQGATR